MSSVGLHLAVKDYRAQFYIGCAQVRVTSNGTASPTGFKLPGAYNVDEPGLKIDIYNTDLSQYQLRTRQC